MGLTRCYKMTVFTFIFAVFLLNLFTDVYYCTSLFTVLPCCKNERKPYWNTTCCFNLVIVVINTLFADAK